jgi:hypothetical protein
MDARSGNVSDQKAVCFRTLHLCVVYFVLQRCFEQSQCFLLGSEQAKLVVAEDVLMSVIGDMLE